MLSLFFAAKAGEAPTLQTPDDLPEESIVACKNVDPAAVGDMDFLVTGERTREPVCVRDDEEACIFRLDRKLVDALAVLEDQQLHDVADEWGIYDLSDTKAFLAELRALAQTAVASDRDVFLSL
jgi:hypothetical protein